MCSAALIIIPVSQDKTSRISCFVANVGFLRYLALWLHHDVGGRTVAPKGRTSEIFAYGGKGD